MRPEHQRLNLQQAPLMRLQVAADARSGQHYALLQLHHLVCDHESLGIMLSELMAHTEGRANTLPDAMPYRNHVAQALAHARANDAEAFFRGKLADVDEPTAPFGLLDVQAEGGRIAEAHCLLEASLSQRIRSQARRLGVSAATLFHAAWALVVSRTSGRDDVVFGSVLLGRLHGDAGAQRILGMFMNTLPLRLRLREVSARELVELTQREIVELIHNEQASLAVAQRCSGIRGATPLFSALMNYRHSATDIDSEFTSAGVELIAIESWTNYPIVLSVDELRDGYAVTVKIDRQLDQHRLMDQVCTALGSLLAALETAPLTPALALETLPDAERRRIIETFNATRTSRREDNLIHRIFEEQVARVPDVVAVEHEGQRLTYWELNECANQLARYLRAREIGPDHCVALCTERSLEMVIGMLGILKAGGAYVPIDPAYPPAQIGRVLADSGASVLLTQDSLRDTLPESDAQIITLDADWWRIARESPGNLSDPELGLTTNHLAYIIYTSGSTGRPKGVMVEHRNVVKLWRSLQEIYSQAQPCRRVAVNASFAFDASVKQFIQLLSGRTIVLLSQEVRLDASRMLNLIERGEIDCIDCTPSQLQSWLAAGLLESGRRPLRVVLVGGEPIDAHLWGTLAAFRETDFFNVYGPTECTVDATFARLRGDPMTPHIGRPMQNTRVYVLDRLGRPAPIGVPGELYIAGGGVARGYLNQMEATALRFITDPFVSGEIMYRTEDLGRWRADGTLEYLGRNDDQVKIRGHRVEPGEIEAQLKTHARVREAAVIAREDSPGEKRLVAYVTLRAGNLQVEELRRHVQSVLPEYMVPSAFVVLDKLPLTPGGKLDRRALPVPDLTAYISREYEPPVGEVERALQEIWQHLLHVERVGRNDNFFELGGHSLHGVKLISTVAERFHVKISVVALFKYPTVRSMAELVENLCALKPVPSLVTGVEIEEGMI
jgi:amino acid adenylation domain-containing protein